jgi:uncharacterized membrane protein YphA (DoxX/SURF4 family)
MERRSVELALRLLSIGVGVFFLGMSLNKLAWLENPGLLAQRFERWLPNAAPYAKVYLEAVAIPGSAVFARVVPVGEFLTAVAMLTGVYTRPAAGMALAMILNFHLATSSFSSWDFLRDGTGPPLFAALLALAIAGRNLPFSIRLWNRRARAHEDVCLD